MPATSHEKNLESLQESILEFLARFPTELFKSKELSRRLGIRTEKEYQRFKQVLRTLQDARKILRVNGKRFGHLHLQELLTGTIELTDRGLGFVTVGEGGEQILIRPDRRGDAVNGDAVQVSVFAQSTKKKDRGVRREGEVVKVLDRGVQTLVGTLEQERRQFFVVPDDRKKSAHVRILKEHLNGGVEGDKVVVEIIASEGNYQNPEGRVTEVLGRSGELSAEMMSVVREYRLPTGFPEEVLSETDAIPSEIPQSEISRRVDLRDLLCFTIDPEDAKDFDDAVSLEPLADGNLRLGVHIADVSHYVRTGTALDKEALSRGTSVYFPNGVIPMLPERLSNGLCSLRPDEDRLAFSVMINVSPRGSVKDYEIHESVLRSKKRFSYEAVQHLLEQSQQGRAVHDQDAPFLDALLRMQQLSSVLTKKRMREGSIDFDSAEAKFELDEQGRPLKIIKKTRLESHRLVEEFMLLANRVVAGHIGLPKKEDHAKPFLYRVHDSPDPERINELAVFVQMFGYKLNIDGGVTSKALQNLFEQVKGTEVENVINQVALRTMAKAVYSDRNIGHYGLAFDYYAHFTSPIRRYPDLAVHRMLKQYSAGISLKEREAIREQLPYIAKQSSEMERRAMEAERAAVKVMQVEFMKRHLGDEFHAVISGVTRFGLFVSLTDLLVEGMIHVRELTDDFYVYDEKHYAMKGKRKGRQFRLGDPLEVKVVRVDPEERRIDFALLEKDGQRRTGKTKRGHTG